MEKIWLDLSHQISLKASLKEAVDLPFDIIQQLCTIISKDPVNLNKTEQQSIPSSIALSLLNILVEIGSPKELFLALLDEFNKFQDFDISQSLLPLIIKTLLRLPKKESTLASWQFALTTIYANFLDAFDQLHPVNEYVTPSKPYTSEYIFSKIDLFFSLITPVVTELRMLDKYIAISQKMDSRKSKLRLVLFDSLLHILACLYKHHKDVKLMANCVYSTKNFSSILELEPDVIKLNFVLIESMDRTKAKHCKKKEPKKLKDFDGNIEDTVNAEISDPDMSDDELEDDNSLLPNKINKLIGLTVLNQLCMLTNSYCNLVYSHSYQLKSILLILGRFSYEINSDQTDLSIQLSGLHTLIVDLVYVMLIRCNKADGLYGECFEENLLKPVLQFMISSQSKELTRLCTKLIVKMFELINSEYKVVLYTYLVYSFNHTGVHSFAVQRIKDELGAFLKCDGKCTLTEAQCISLLQLCFINTNGNSQKDMKTGNSKNIDNKSGNSRLNDSSLLMERAGLHMSRLNLLRFLLLQNQCTGNSSTTQQCLQQQQCQQLYSQQGEQSLEQQQQWTLQQSVEQPIEQQSMQQHDFIQYYRERQREQGQQLLQQQQQLEQRDAITSDNLETRVPPSIMNNFRCDINALVTNSHSDQQPSLQQESFQQQLQQRDTVYSANVEVQDPKTALNIVTCDENVTLNANVMRDVNVTCGVNQLINSSEGNSQQLTTTNNVKFVALLNQICSNYLKKIRRSITMARSQLTGELNSLDASNGKGNGNSGNKYCNNLGCNMGTDAAKCWNNENNDVSNNAVKSEADIDIMDINCGRNVGKGGINDECIVGANVGDRFIKVGDNVGNVVGKCGNDESNIGNNIGDSDINVDSDVGNGNIARCNADDMIRKDTNVGYDGGIDRGNYAVNRDNDYRGNDVGNVDNVYTNISKRIDIIVKSNAEKGEENLTEDYRVKNKYEGEDESSEGRVGHEGTTDKFRDVDAIETCSGKYGAPEKHSKAEGVEGKCETEFTDSVKKRVKSDEKKEESMLSVGLGEVGDEEWAEVLWSRLNELDLLMCVLVRVEELYGSI